MRCAILLMSLAVALAMRRRPIVRVIGGREDVTNEFPFTVVLEITIPKLTRICTGSLIAEEWVLTAAHCCINPRPMVVKYADVTLPSNETKAYAKVIKIYPHPGYKDTGHVMQNFNDIGLLHVQRIYRPIAKLSAVDYKAWMGLEVKFAGFGLMRLVDPEDPTTSDTDSTELKPLQVGEAVVISCKQDGAVAAFSPAVCIAPRCGAPSQPYYGDSGGPLTRAGRVLGVCSGSAGLHSPLVGYTPVSPYLEWIYDTVHSK